MTNSSALLAPSTVSTASNSSAFSPLSSNTTVLLATAPIVVPLIFKKPVTIFFAYSDFTSINKPSSAISESARAESVISASKSLHNLLRSSWQSVTASSSLLAGRNETNCLIPFDIVSSSPTKSATPASAWNLALDVSGLEA